MRESLLSNVAYLYENSIPAMATEKIYDGFMQMLRFIKIKCITSRSGKLKFMLKAPGYLIYITV
jgi:hypothetical protein